MLSDGLRFDLESLDEYVAQREDLTTGARTQIRARIGSVLERLELVGEFPMPGSSARFLLWSQVCGG